MSETMTMERILASMLSRVPNDLDKREGSVIYDALAPAAAELAQLYAELEVNDNLSYADTATGEYLSRITSQFGVNRKEATFALRLGSFYGEGDEPLDVPLGGRYAIDGLAYRISDSEGLPAGKYELICEVAGVVGNQRFGDLLPFDYVDGLARAELGIVLVPGQDEENDDLLRERFFAAVNEPAFGGNVANYKDMMNTLAGVGATKVYPVWQGGGTVRAAIIASDWSAPSEALVADVQAIVDPLGVSGEGQGLAPIGHKVTVSGVQDMTIQVATTLTLATGVTTGQVQADVEAAIESYLLELRRDWADQAYLTVRTAQMEARILSVSGVEDVNGTELNGASMNVLLESDQIPVMGEVTLNA